jgi:hypothetical protein
MAHVDQAGQAQGDPDVDPAGPDPQPHRLDPASTAGAAVIRALVCGQRGVQVDHVRHHGGADDARGDDQAAPPGQVRDEAGRRPGQVG